MRWARACSSAMAAACGPPLPAACSRATPWACCSRWSRWAANWPTCARASPSTCACAPAPPPSTSSCRRCWRYALQHASGWTSTSRCPTGVVAALREGRADLGVFVEAPRPKAWTAACSARRAGPGAAAPPAGGRGAVAFAEALDEDWISLADGAALLQKQHEAAHAAGRPLRLRMQVRSFDAVCHLVASGLGIAVLPRNAALPMVGAMKLRWRACPTLGLAPPAAGHPARAAGSGRGRAGALPGPAFAKGESSAPQRAIDGGRAGGRLAAMETTSSLRPAGGPGKWRDGPAHRRPLAATLADFGADVVKIEPPAAGDRCATGAC